MGFRAAFVFFVVSALGTGPGVVEKRRPKVDPAAMAEAIADSRPEVDRHVSPASYAHFLRARLLHNQGDHRRAAQELQLALATDEGNSFLLTLLAEEYARLSDMDKAERELRRVIERTPDYYPAQLLIGRLLLEGQRLTRAKLHLRRAIALRPQDPDAYLVLAQLELEQGQADGAIRVVEELSRALPGESSGFKRLGLAFAERSDWVRAEQMLTRALAQDPGDYDCWLTLAQVHEATERLADAERAYSRAVEREPESREALLGAGRLALKREALADAKAYFDQLLSLSDDPENVVKVAFSYLAARHVARASEVLDSAKAARQSEPRLSFYSGLVHEKLRQHSRAADAYGEVPRNSDLFHEARLRRAGSLSLMGQTARALDLLRRGLDEKPDYLALYPAYARVLERAGEPRRAESFLRNALRTHPAPEVFEALAALYERQGRLGEAILLLTDAVTARPGDEMLLFTLGAVYERQGEIEKSLEQMRAVLAVNPDNSAALNFIGYTLAEAGRDFEEAERLLTRALEIKPDNGAYMDSLGWVYFRQGDFERAVDILERAAALAPGEPVINEHLGDAYSEVERRDRAAEAYRRALDALAASGDLEEARKRRPAIERKLKILSTESAGR